MHLEVLDPGAFEGRRGEPAHSYNRTLKLEKTGMPGRSWTMRMRAASVSMLAVFLGVVICLVCLPQASGARGGDERGVGSAGKSDVGSQGTGSNMIPKRFRRVPDIAPLKATPEPLLAGMAKSGRGTVSARSERSRLARQRHQSRLAHKSHLKKHEVESQEDHHSTALLRSKKDGSPSSASSESAPDTDKEDAALRKRWAYDEFLGQGCWCEGGCRFINEKSGVLTHGGGETCSRSGNTGKYGARTTCWWIINSVPGAALTVRKALIDNNIFSDSLVIYTCQSNDTLCTAPTPVVDTTETLADAVDTDDVEDSTRKSDSGIFLVEFQSDSFWVHEGFELVWGADGDFECGDGVHDDGHEDCDDGNEDDGDGCSSSCRAEPGYTCGSDGTCTCTCCVNTADAGKLTVGGGKRGYDPNTKCWGTVTLPSSYVTITGFDVDPGDVLKLHSCTGSVEGGDRDCSEVGVFSIANPPPGSPVEIAGELEFEFMASCAGGRGFEIAWADARPAQCGDSDVDALEQCDDGNDVARDGCSDQCSVEIGFHCGSSGGKSVCTATCGDGIKAGTEECDDGNTNATDGCSPLCTCEQSPCTYTATPASHLASLLASAATGTTIMLSAGVYDDSEKHMALTFSAADVKVVGSSSISYRKAALGEYTELNDLNGEILQMTPAFTNREGSFFSRGATLYVKESGAEMDKIHLDGPLYIHPSAGKSLSMDGLDAQTVRIFSPGKCTWEHCDGEPVTVVLNDVNIVRQKDYHGQLYIEGDNVRLHVTNFWSRDVHESARFVVLGNDNLFAISNSLSASSPFLAGAGIEVEGDRNKVLMHQVEMHGHYQGPSGGYEYENRLRRDRYDGCGGAFRVIGGKNNLTLVGTDIWSAEAEYSAGSLLLLGDDNYLLLGNETVAEMSAAYEDIAGVWAKGDRNTVEMSGFLSREEVSPQGTPCWDYDPDFEDGFCHPATCGGHKVEGDHNIVLLDGAHFDMDKGNAPEYYGGTPDGAVCVSGNNNSLVSRAGTKFTSCSSDTGSGGALSIQGEGNIVLVEDTVFVKNQALGHMGGSIAMYGGETSEIVLDRCLFEGSTSNMGGAVGVEGRRMKVTVSEGNRFVANFAHDADGGGLRVKAPGGSLKILSSEFQGNHAGGSGGAVWSSTAVLEMAYTSLESNIADGEGGGLYVTGDSGCKLEARDTILISNNAHTGGGVSVLACEALLQNVTLSQNSAVEGGGIHYDGLSASKLQVVASKAEGNKASEGSGAGLGLVNADLNVSGSYFFDNLAPLGYGAGVHITGSGGTSRTWNVARSTFRGNVGQGGGGLYVSSNSHYGSFIADGKGIPLALDQWSYDGVGTPDVLLQGKGGLAPSAAGAPEGGGSAFISKHELVVVKNVTGGMMMTVLTSPNAAVYAWYKASQEALPRLMNCNASLFLVHNTYGNQVLIDNLDDVGKREELCPEPSPVAVSLQAGHRVALMVDGTGQRMFAMDLETAGIIGSVAQASPSIQRGSKPALAPLGTLQTVTGLTSDSYESVMGWGLVGSSGKLRLVGGSFDVMHAYSIAEKTFSSIVCSLNGHDPTGASGGYQSVVLSPDEKKLFIARYEGPGQYYRIWQYTFADGTCKAPEWNLRLNLKAVRAMAVSPDGSALYLAEKKIHVSDLNEEHHIRVVNLQTGSSTFVKEVRGGRAEAPLAYSNIVHILVKRTGVYVLAAPGTSLAKSQDTTWVLHFVQSSTLQLKSTLFHTNQALSDGGGVKLKGLSFMSEVLFEDVTFTENAAATGGGMSVSDVSTAVLVKASNFSQNSAQKVGGGISARAASLITVEDTIVERNEAISGSGVHSSSIADSTPGHPEGTNAGTQILNMVRVRVKDNHNREGAGVTFGGGMLLEGSMVVEVGAGSSFEGNRAREGGAIAVLDECKLSVVDAVVTQNTADDCGGAVVIYSQYPLMTSGDVEISENKAVNGGAVCDVFRHPVTLECSPQPDGVPHILMVATNNGPSTVFRENAALGGGGISFAKCVQPQNHLKGDRTVAELGYESGRNKAAFGELFASDAKALAVHKYGDGRYSPGQELRTQLKLVDFFDHTIKRAGGALPLRVLATLRRRGDPPLAKALISKEFEFGIDGICDLVLDPVKIQWPTHEGASGFEFASDLFLSHKVMAPMGSPSGILSADSSADGGCSSLERGDFMLNVVEIDLTRVGCQAGTSYNPPLRTCSPCFPSQYVVNPETDICQECPRWGGICDGKTLTPLQSGAVWTAIGGKYLLQSCPPGHMLVNSSDGDSTGTFVQENQHCKKCSTGSEYINHPNTQSCQPCPVGGRCDGSKVTGISGSEWTVEGVVTRLTRCPKGYVIVRGSNPVLDQCQECQKDSYLIDEAKWDTLDGEAWLVSPNLSDAQSKCRPCEPGLICDGGDRVYQRRGFWAKGTTNISDGVEARRSAAVLLGNASRIQVYRCEENSCTGNQTCRFPCPAEFTCSKGRYGPVCGLCLDGYVATGGTCKECAPEDVARLTSAAWGVGIALTLVLWVGVSWWPLITKVKTDDGRVATQSVAEVMAKWFGLPFKEDIHKKYGNGRLRRLYHSVGSMKLQEVSRAVTGYGRVVISFYQILSSLPATFYHLTWTPGADVLEKSQFLRIDVASLDDLACLMEGMHFRDKLLWYTVAPIIVSVLLFVPFLTTLLLGKIQTGKWSGHPKYTQVIATYFWSQEFFLFLIYPTVSIAALSGINCRQIGNQWFLTADVSEECTTSGSLFGLAVISIILYPVGVPFMMFLLLWFQRVPHIAQRKQDRALLSAMVDHYKAKGTTAEVLTLGRYLGLIGDAGAATPVQQGLVESEAFKRRLKRLYDVQVGTKASPAGAEGAEGKDADGENGKDCGVQRGGILACVPLTGKETFPQFESLIVGFFKSVGLFLGFETLEVLSVVQCVALLRLFEQSHPGHDDLESVPVEELRKMVMLCARTTMRKKGIVVSTLSWDDMGGQEGMGGQEERKVVRTVGSMFLAFKVQYWYYEILNTVHKLLMTSILTHILSGNYSQYAVGIAILYGFLCVTMKQQPYVLSALNNLQMYALVVLIITLFYGMMKNINDFLLSAAGLPYGQGQPYTILVIVLCATFPAAPFVWESILAWLASLRIFSLDKDEQALKDFHSRHQSIQLAVSPRPTPPAAIAPLYSPNEAILTAQLPSSTANQQASLVTPWDRPPLPPVGTGDANGNRNGVPIAAIDPWAPPLRIKRTLGKLKALPSQVAPA